MGQIVITGQMEGMTREEARKLAEARGYEYARRVTKETTLVVAGTHPGSKVVAAQAKGIPVVSESEFVNAQ